MANPTSTYATSWHSSTSPPEKPLASPDLRTRSSQSPFFFPDLPTTAPPILVTDAENEPATRDVFFPYAKMSPSEQDVEKSERGAVGQTLASMATIDPRLVGGVSAAGDLMQSGEWIAGVPGICSANSGGSRSNSTLQIPGSQNPVSSNQHTLLSPSFPLLNRLPQDLNSLPLPAIPANPIPRTLIGPHSTRSAAHCCGFALTQPPVNLTSFRQRLLTWAAGISQWTSFERRSLNVLDQLTGSYEYVYKVRRQDNFPGGLNSTRVFIGGDTYRSIPYELIVDNYTMQVYDLVKYGVEELQIECRDQGRHSKIVIEVWMSREQDRVIRTEEYDEKQLLRLSGDQAGGYIQG